MSDGAMVADVATANLFGEDGDVAVLWREDYIVPFEAPETSVEASAEAMPCGDTAVYVM